jgi:TfoX/Sxy family transcriptional regulator of competence genes
MATTPDYVEYVASQASGCGLVRYRKMFGDYMVYIDDKPVLLVCDNTVFVKIRPCLDALMKDAGKGFPYDGAKEHFILDIDDTELVNEVVAALLPVTPMPRKKEKNKRK